MPAQAFPLEWWLVAGSLDHAPDQMWPGQLRVAPVDLSRVGTNTCAVSPYPCDSANGYPLVPGNSVRQDNRPRAR
jgi:hypothetical protein